MSDAATRGGVLLGYRRETEDPPFLYEEYRATRTRAPKRPLVPLAHTLSEITGPVYGHERVGELDHDLTRQHEGEPSVSGSSSTAGCSTATGVPFATR